MQSRTLALASSAIALVFIGAAQAAAQTAPPQSTAQDPATQETAAEIGSEEIVVTGLRRSLESAQAIKRNSDGIVDAIVAEDIGKLPDITASAALARVTGVQVNRGAGEAAQVQIRGLPDISTTYNGREIFTAENRFVAIQDFPAGAVAALEVYKSGTANLIEGGIGGQVNVRSRRPFDFDGFELSGSLNGVHFEQSQALDWNGNLLISNRWETGIGEIGILVNGAMTNIDFLDATRENDRFVSPEPNNDIATGDFRRPNGQGIFYGSGNRWRPSVNAAIQWKPAPNFEIYVDGLFQGYRAEDRNHWLFVPTFGATEFSNVVLRDDGSNSLQSATVTNAAAPDGYDAFSKQRTDTYQIAGGAIWTADRLKLSADIAYTDSTYTQRNANIDYLFTSSPVRNVVFESSQGEGGGTFDFLDFNAADPNNYQLRGLFDTNFQATGQDIQARFDAEYDTGIDVLSRIQIGFRYNDRDASRRNGQRYAGLAQLGILYRDLPVDIALIPRGFRYDQLQPDTLFAGPTFDSVFANLAALRTIAQRGGDQAAIDFANTGDPAFNPLETFTANERAYAGYAQVKYAFDLGLPVDGLIGVRVVKTETTLNGTSRDDATGVFSPVTQQSEYTDYLPNASLRAELTDGLQLRLAYTQTRTRPNFIDLNPSTTFGTIPSSCTPDPANPEATGPDAPGCNIFNSSGNPDLQPLQSNNYDISLEWYFSRTGSLTGGLFRRDVSNFIFRNSVTEEIPNAPNVITNLPTNGGDGRLQGAEVAFTSFLDFDSLPQWAQGFGVQANYTYIDATTELAPGFQDRLPGQQPFPGVSEHSYNLVGLYERPQFSARLAYNWRSEFVIEYQDLQQGFLSPLTQQALGTLDFSASVTPIENITIAFDMLNILADPVKTDRVYNAAGDAYNFQTRYIERVYSLGVRFRF
ncbi:TonB-dependent receptor [Sphingomonas japonica]|uniref:TonB-dependent receptor n=1 Tax=Sphingomonas japonica TaxID=511662 RepID=A0ABX0TXV6_9SPHN|nr:TonB-dependent receptor [Sphingomonas japonica]NIJ23130.1 TonB-dependent receptor [Sphingomonas japonica]